MAKTNISAQLDAYSAAIKSVLDTFRKKAFRFSFQAFQAFRENAKHAVYSRKLKDTQPSQIFKLPRLLMWLGIAAGITGILILLNPNLFIGWQFILLLLITLLGPVITDFFMESSKEAKDTLEGYEGRELIGRSFILKQPIIDETVAVNLHGKSWTLQGKDCPAGTRVKVVAVSGQTIHTIIIG